MNNILLLRVKCRLREVTYGESEDVLHVRTIYIGLYQNLPEAGCAFRNVETLMIKLPGQGKIGFYKC